MGLTPINGLNLNNMSEVNSVRTRNVENIDKSSSDLQQKAEKIELPEIASKGLSSFYSNIVGNMNKISNLQQQQSSVTSQLDTLSKITQLTTQVIESPKQGQVLNDIQPEIQSLMNDFNTVSAEMKSAQSSSSASRTYFDGVVGAIPLSGEEIYQAVKLQQDRLEQVNHKIEVQVKNIVSETEGSIELEKKSEFKVDFEKESLEFSGQSLKSFEGSIPVAQANGNTEHSINLLAS